MTERNTEKQQVGWWKVCSLSWLHPAIKGTCLEVIPIVKIFIMFQQKKIQEKTANRETTEKKGKENKKNKESKNKEKKRQRKNKGKEISLILSILISWLIFLCMLATSKCKSHEG